MKLRRHLIICFVLVAAAAYLRVGKSLPLRDEFTTLIGYEGRAVLEHFLAGIGIPLGLAILIFDAFRRGEVFDPTGTRWPAIFLVSATTLLSLAYSVGSYQFELQQALVSVYGKPARGYFQRWQFMADTVGASLSVLLALHCTRAQTNNSLKPKQNFLRYSGHHDQK